MAFDLDRLNKDIQSRFVASETIKTFTKFIEDAAASPEKYCRNSADYLKDVFDYYGHYTITDIDGEPIRRWKLFDLFGPVFGHERPQNQIYNYVKSFSENRVNKIILLHGPNGSAKTSIISALMAAAEDYAKKPEGISFSFNWIFSDSAEHEVGLGFKTEPRVDPTTDSYAFISPDDITFKLPCPMKDNPLLLIPNPERAQLLKSFGLKKLPHHLMHGELCQKCHEIYTQLSMSYEGDWRQIMKHIQVERFYLSKRFRKGLISIDPQQTPDAASRALNLEKSYRIPMVLAMSSIYEPYGDLIDANRGIVEFSEFFKRHPDINKYLLTTAEWGTVNLDNFTGYLDCVIFATCNEKNFSIFKTHFDWPSFNGRLAPVKVPYLLRWAQEKRTCQRIFGEHARSMHIAPHTIDVFALWSIGTRLRQSQLNIAKNLSHVQKAFLYDRAQVPSSWTLKDQQALLNDLKKIACEYDESRDRHLGKGTEDSSYEGRSGASYRDMENIIINAIYQKHFLSPLSIFKAIEEVIKNESIYEFVKLHKGNDGDITFEKGHIDPRSLLKEVRAYYADQVRTDIRRAAGLIAEEEYLKLFERYIWHVKAFTRSEKIKNPQTGIWEDADSKLMSKVETKLGIKPENITEHRKDIFSKIAAWAIKNDINAGIPYTNLFSDLLDILRKSSDNEHKEQLFDLQQYLLAFGSDNWRLVPDDHKEQVTETYAGLLKLGYTDESLKEAVGFTHKETTAPEIKKGS